MALFAVWTLSMRSLSVLGLGSGNLSHASISSAMGLLSVLTSGMAGCRHRASSLRLRAGSLR
jgi:hypothetical protein